MSPRDGDPMIVLREPIRSSRRHFALIVALAATVAVSLVGTNLPARRHGEAYAASRYIPFRPATAAELAVILRSPAPERPPFGSATVPQGAQITTIEGDDVTVIARTFVRHADDPAAGQVKSGTEQPEEVSWSGYVLEHHVSRVALEAALGQPIKPEDVSPTTEPVSFRSDRWWAYAAEEVGVLTALFALGLTGAAVIRRPMLLPLWFVAWSLLWAPVTAWFSPAYFDADMFHQRVVIEDLFEYLTLPAHAGAPLAVLLAAGHWARALVLGFFRGRTSRLIFALGLFAAGLPAAGAILWVSAGWTESRTEAEGKAAAVAKRLHGAALERIAKEQHSASLTSAIAATAGYDDDVEDNPRVGRTNLFVPLGGGRFLFVYNNGASSDFRTLPTAICGDEVVRAVATGKVSATPLWHWLAWPIIRREMNVAVPILVDGRVLGVALAPRVPDERVVDIDVHAERSGARAQLPTTMIAAEAAANGAIV